MAAESLKHAIDCFKKEIGLSDEDAFYDYESTEFPLDYQIGEDETKTKMTSLTLVVADH